MRIYDDYHNAGNPQCNFLKLFDGILQADVGNSSTATIHTTRMSFIFSGAFSGGLAKIIGKRRDTSVSIGFGAERSETSKTLDMLKYATMHDIEQYGIMAELCGRINYLFYLPPLTIDDYKTLIKGSGGSMLERYRNLFSIHGVDTNISDTACEYIAEAASKNGLGARSINPLLYEKFQQSFPVIDRDPKINKVVLNGIRGYCLRATKEDEPCELKRKYRKFRKFYGVDMQEFLTEAIREIRCNRYTSLLESLN